MSEHAAWLIDLDGTLYRPMPVKLAMGAELCLSSRRVRRVVLEFRRQHELLRRSECRLPFDEQLTRTAQAVGWTADDVRELIDEWMVRRPGRWLYRFRRRELLNEIAAFRAGGGRTALVSDYPAREKLAALRVDDLFDVVVANGESDHQCRLKPAADAFLAATSLLNVSACECLVIGDRADADGLAAERAGMSFRRIR